jgi:hypothetical protein
MTDTDPKPKPPKAGDFVKLVAQEDGSYRASWPIYAYRFLMESGATVDVESTSDDSRLRAVIVEAHGTIVGSTRLGCVGWT